MIGGQYKNIVLVGLIIGAFLLYMLISTYWVLGDISNNRSCVKTCDTPITKGTVKEKERQ
ncbi:MAG: hypothetical protein DSZ05_02865 [Sulfurospirillum sp.]|nr:MAG: hypothetical protein DSZ05_02865 [Sulfurospirillum sp.]